MFAFRHLACFCSLGTGIEPTTDVARGGKCSLGRFDIRVAHSPTREDQRNRASQGTNQRDESLAREAPRELQPNAVPDDHEEPDRSGALPPVSTAPTSRPTRQGLGEVKASGQPASATRPRYETTGRMPKSENHRGRERQVSSSASSGGAAVESTPSSRRKSNRQNGPEFSSTVIPEFPRSLLPTSVTR